MTKGALARAVLAALVLALLIVPGLVAGGRGGEDDERSTRSREPGGWLGARALLAALGYDVRSWERPPGELPAGALCWLPRVPFSRGALEAAAEERAAARSGGDASERAAERRAERDAGDRDAAARGGASERDEAARDDASDQGEAAHDGANDAAKRGEHDEDAEATADAETEPELDRAVLGAAHSPLAYRRFVEEGGTLVVAAGRLVRELCADALGVGALERLEAPGPASAVATRVPLASGEVLELDWPMADPLERVARRVRSTTLVSDAGGRALAVQVRLGAGSVVVLAWDGFLDNERLAKGDAALFLVRLVEALEPSDRAPARRPIVFDEYALGRWVPASELEIAFGPRLRPLSVAIALFCLVIAWRAAWVREFPRDPPPLDALSPLARARAVASLFVRARRADRLADVLVARVLERLGRELGALPAQEGAARGEGEDAEREQEARARATLARMCERLGWSSRHAAIEARLFAPVRDAAELEALHAELAALEARARAASARATASLA